MSAQRDTAIGQTTFDVSGNGEASITVKTDFIVSHTRVSAAPVPPATVVVKKAKALLYLNGEEFEGTNSGATGDTSNTRHLMAAGDTLTCRWTGGDPGALATIRIRGISYQPGEGIKAV